MNMKQHTPLSLAFTIIELLVVVSILVTLVLFVYTAIYNSRVEARDSVREGQVVLFARTMEQSKNANYNDVCTHGSRDGVPANASSYMVIIQ